MTPIVIDTLDQMEKLFDLDEWRDRIKTHRVVGTNPMRVLASVESLDLTDEARNFLYEHDLYFPRQFRLEWIHEELLDADGKIYHDVKAKFYLPGDFAVLFKLTVL